MIDFPACEPDALRRKNAWKIVLYKKGSFDRDTKVYTDPEQVKTYAPSDLVLVESVEESKESAKWQVVFKIRTEDFTPFDFAEVYAASYEPGYQTPPYYLIYKMPYSTHSSSLTEGTTAVTLEMSQTTVDELLKEAIQTGMFAEALEAVYDERAGDWTYRGETETRVMLTLDHLIKAAGYATGTYPMIAAETSDGIKAYNAAFPTDTSRYSHGDYYNDYELRHYISEGGLRRFISARNDDGREKADYITLRIRKTGDVYLYKTATETPTNPVKTYTEDMYARLEFGGDSEYKNAYTMDCRGDIRLETGDLIDIETVGVCEVRRIEMTYDGTLGGSMLQTRVAGTIRTAEGYGSVSFVGLGSRALASALFYGAAVQNGVPSPTAPVPIAVNDSVWTLNGRAVTVPNLAKIGDAVDTYDAQSGRLTRAVVRKVFDGTENINLVTSSVANYFALSVGAQNSVVDGSIICTRLSQGDIRASTATVGINIINSAGYHDARLVWRMPTQMTVAQLKAQLAEWYAAGVPMTVYYALSVPVTEVTAAQAISQTDGANTLRQTTGSVPNTHAKIEYYG